jgi:hypothetical protein
MAESDNLLLKPNYILRNYSVPSQAKSEAEFRLIANVGSTVENSMILSLLVPFVFMLFMSVSMEKVWSFYLML